MTQRTLSPSALSFAALALLWVSTAQAQLPASKHNLSAAGSGTVRAVTETEVCGFCHSPHDALMSRPLWNHTPSIQSYSLYSSSTFQGAPALPNGTTPLCLSCHDGTVPVGSLLYLGMGPALVDMVGTNSDGGMPAGRTLLGVDLTNDHPVSFVFNAALTSADSELVVPTTGYVRLKLGDDGGVREWVQCTSCHDPHGTAYPKFLRASPDDGALCLKCHDKPGWVGSTHQSALTVYPAGSSTTVRQLACLSCHAPHNAPAGAQRLLRHGADGGTPTIEYTCFGCHRPASDGGVAVDLASEFSKPYGHPIASFAGHQPVFTSASPVEPALNPSRHVECVDCHNPHRVTAANRLDGMRGISLDGGLADDVTQERDLSQQEICFRCHGDTYLTVMAATWNGYEYVNSSGINTGNKRLQFQPTNSAFHPVGAPGRNTSANLAAQLQGGLGIGSTVLCTDCHNSEVTQATLGPVSNYTGPAATGPHGSVYPSLLRANYRNQPLTFPLDWNPDNFALCFRCHDQTRLTARRFSDGARTNFYDSINGKDNLHWLHLIDRVDTSRAVCKTCHSNVHSNATMNSTQYKIDGVIYYSPPPNVPTRLVSFGDGVLPYGDFWARPEWVFDTVTKERRCYLKCHDTSMGGFRYRPPSGDLP